ncbi:cortactin-binding protein, putative [Talaromyces stipitatus ATCC 10500]|uniref:Cortactin-binding protein, putative n=1 Tax=Talaromyces stipitatus (strain ATCC 10500 / CBS 375.48 / QM 6759 / NRRL 1006) TaxID=441959 RepID=B8LUZ1_TALSN|nr:cortactin-binding protein, putative [Talaromyces stipitatus ATCC 10500]EED22612.1 cortactin-binding protein, putative [Talaromyces stipitatus ATCC 10500]
MTSMHNKDRVYRDEVDPSPESTSDSSSEASNFRAARFSRTDRRSSVDESALDRVGVMAADINRQREDNGTHTNGDTQFQIAVRNADFGTLVAMQEDDVEIDARDSNGKTALHLALEQRDLGLVEVLLRFKPNLNIKNPNGKTPLHLSVSAEWEPAVRLLLSHNLDIDATDDKGNTALHLACLGGSREIVQTLLERGANVHIRNSTGRTALQLAVLSRTPRLPELLLQSGADIDDVRHGSGPDGDPKDIPKDDPMTQPSHSKQKDTMETEPSDIGSVLTEFSEGHWDGVRRDNGDGFTLANYDNHDIFFDAKVEAIRLLMHEGLEMHAIQLKLNFMKPFSNRNRIRYAKVDARFATVESGVLPHIHSIMPQADRVEVSEQEISSGQTFTVGASGNGGPSSVNISMEGSKSRKSTFKGVRIIHGVVKDKMHASWRMYEEPGSQSGLPEIVRLLLLVQCNTEFDLRLSMSVKACHFSSFRIPRTLDAKTGPPYRIPSITSMLKLERAMKLKNILNVADRAATTVQETRILEREFTRLIQNHSNKALIMEASRDPEFVQEWADIADASRLGDFSMLHDKVLEMDVSGNARRLYERVILEPEDHSAQTDMEEPRRYHFPSPSPRNRVMREYRRRGLRRGGIEGDRPYDSQATNAMESFSAVGPGYKVSRLA